MGYSLCLGFKPCSQYFWVQYSCAIVFKYFSGKVCRCMMMFSTAVRSYGVRYIGCFMCYLCCHSYFGVQSTVYLQITTAVLQVFRGLVRYSGYCWYCEDCSYNGVLVNYANTGGMDPEYFPPFRFTIRYPASACLLTGTSFLYSENLTSLH